MWSAWSTYTLPSHLLCQKIKQQQQTVQADFEEDSESTNEGVSMKFSTLRKLKRLIVSLLNTAQIKQHQIIMSVSICEKVHFHLRI